MNERLLTHLEKALGADSVQTDSEVAKALGSAGIQSTVACSPKTDGQVAEVLRLANEYGVAVLPMGNGTAMDYGNAVSREALLLRMQHFNQMLDYEPADMVACAQAGMSIETFNRALSEKGQWLPLDVSGQATLGGLVATDRSGPRRLGYGTLRDSVLGMTVINGDGVVRKCGGKVVKNVTGYALEKLYIGSLGTLGVITSLTVKVRPEPETRCAFLMEIPNPEEGFDHLRALVMKWSFVFAVAAFEGGKLEGVLGVEGSSSDQARMVRELKKAASETGMTIRESDEALVASSAWSDRPRPWPKPSKPLLVRLDWPALATAFGSQRQLLERLVGESPFDSSRVYFEFPGRVTVELFGSEADQPKGVDCGNGLDAILKGLRAEGIAASVAWRTPDLMYGEGAFGPERCDWALMRQIKVALDPKAILNPGRYLPGMS